METPPRSPADDFRSVALIYQLVSEFVSPILLGLLIDWQFRSAPAATLCGVLLGSLLSGWRIARLVRRLSESDRPRKGGSP